MFIEDEFRDEKVAGEIGRDMVFGGSLISVGLSVCQEVRPEGR